MKAFLSKNWEAFGGLIIIIIAFYCGKHFTPTKVETKVITVEVEKTKVVEHRVVVETTKPDGTKTTTTTIDTNTEKETKNDSATTVVKENKSKGLNVYAIGGLDVARPQNGFVVGVHVSKEVLGPISVGAFALSNATVGVSVGLSF